MTKVKMQSLASWLVPVAIAVFAVVAVAYSFSGSAQYEVECATESSCVFEASSVAESMIGASGTRFPNGLSADSTSPSAGEVRGTTLTSTGAASVGGTLAVTGESNLGRLVDGGAGTAISTSSATYSLTAADVCDSQLIQFEATGAQPTVTLPTGTSLAADCLTSDYDVVNVTFANASTVTTTIIAAGSGGTLYANGGDATIGTSTLAIFSFLRTGSTDYGVTMVENKEQ